MKTKFNKSKLFKYSITLSLGIAILGLNACSKLETTKCPSTSTLTTNIEHFTPPGAKVEVVTEKPLQQIKGLCEVVVKINGGPPTVIYTDPKGNYFIAGQLLNAITKENLTQKTMEQFFKVSKNEESNLNQYVAFSYYKGKSYFGTNPPPADKYIYLITDPKCPFCHEAEPLIQKWADKNGVEVRVILFPLPIHPGAFQSAVGLWCNKKGWNSLHAAYNAKSPMSQCPAGDTFIKNSMQEAMKLGVQGTPTIIGMDGKMHPGAPSSEKQLDEWLGK